MARLYKDDSGGDSVLRYAILQLLNRRPLTGYEIKRRFDRTLMFCWHALHSQIYSELKQMEKAGLVTSETHIQVDKPNRHVYTITDAGRKVLREWLAIPPDALKLKDELLLRVFSIHLLTHDEATALLDRAEQLHRQRLAEYEEILAGWRDRLTDGHPNMPQFLGPYLDLMQGIMHERMYLEWIRWARGELEANRHMLAPPDGPVAAAAPPEPTGSKSKPVRSRGIR